MTKDALVQVCKANKGYAAPHLNDQIYLHCKGYMKIENLEPYTELKVLWLEQNSIADLSGLAAQQKLVSLFIQNNALITLQKMDAPLKNLRILNISHNYLTSLKGISTLCPLLETLQVSHNHIASLQACEELWDLRETLTSIDLSFNEIEQYKFTSEAEGASNGEKIESSLPITSDDLIVENGESSLLSFFKDHLPNVSVIYLQGNGIVRSVKNYRRSMILGLPALTYLDQRPVFAEERRVVEAWGIGGEKAEAAERQAIREEKRQHLESCVKILTDKMESSREVRDRLTKQWEQRRDLELERVTERCRALREARSLLETKELTDRSLLEKTEIAAWCDMEDTFAEEHLAMEREEKSRRRAYVQQQELALVKAEAQKEIEEEEAQWATNCGSKTSEKNRKEPVYFDMIQSDEEVFNEMEEAIQNVLHQVNHSSSSASDLRHESGDSSSAAATLRRRSADDARRTAKAERSMHNAVENAKNRLRSEHRAQREERWALFEQWEKRCISRKAASATSE